MSKIQVLCLGEMLWDYLAQQLTSELTSVKSWLPYPGGAVANVACALVKLGTKSAYIGCLGADELGRQLQQLLSSLGVDTTGVVIHPTAPTRRVYVLRPGEGERSFAGFGDYPADAFADAYLQPENLLENLFLEADFLVLGTLSLAYPLTRQAIGQALHWANCYNLKVVVDINWRECFWLQPEEAPGLIRELLKQTDFLKLSREEAQWLFDTTDAGAIAHRQGNLEGVLVTAGANPVSYCLRDNEGQVTPRSFNVVDTTGAGDSFLAGFIHQLVQRGIAVLDNPDTAAEIVTYASLVGGLTTTKLGAIAAQPTAADIETYLAGLS